MKRVIFVFIVLLALFAAFIVLAGSIRQLLMKEGGQKSSLPPAHAAWSEWRSA